MPGSRVPERCPDWSQVQPHFCFGGLLFLFLAGPAACRSFWARDQTHATAVARATTGTMPDPSPAEPPGHSHMSAKAMQTKSKHLMWASLRALLDQPRWYIQCILVYISYTAFQIHLNSEIRRPSLLIYPETPPLERLRLSVQ